MITKRAITLLVFLRLFLLLLPPSKCTRFLGETIKPLVTKMSERLCCIQTTHYTSHNISLRQHLRKLFTVYMHAIDSPIMDKTIIIYHDLREYFKNNQFETTFNTGTLTMLRPNPAYCSKCIRFNVLLIEKNTVTVLVTSYSDTLMLALFYGTVSRYVHIILMKNIVKICLHNFKVEYTISMLYV